MQEVLERAGEIRRAHPHQAHLRAQDPLLSQAAIWIVDTLAEELGRESSQARGALMRALVRRAGYEQADNLLAQDADQVRAALVSRLVGRLARD